jgi:hypothetical protein
MRTKEILANAALLGGAAGLIWAKLPPELTMSKDEIARLKEIEASVHYSGCDEVRRLGLAPLYRGQPGYGSHMDGNGDGIACEPYRGR